MSKHANSNGNSRANSVQEQYEGRFKRENEAAQRLGFSTKMEYDLVRGRVYNWFRDEYKDKHPQYFSTKIKGPLTEAGQLVRDAAKATISENDTAGPEERQERVEAMQVWIENYFQPHQKQPQATVAEIIQIETPKQTGKRPRGEGTPEQPPQKRQQQVVTAEIAMVEDVRPQHLGRKRELPRHNPALPGFYTLYGQSQMGAQPMPAYPYQPGYGYQAMAKPNDFHRQPLCEEHPVNNRVFPTYNPSQDWQQAALTFPETLPFDTQPKQDWRRREETKQQAKPPVGSWQGR